MYTHKRAYDHYLGCHVSYIFHNNVLLGQIYTPENAEVITSKLNGLDKIAQIINQPPTYISEHPVNKMI